MNQAVVVKKKRPPMNEGQAAAVEAMLGFLDKADTRPYFVLSGRAGTGKTFSAEEVRRRVKGRFVFTAPTNKATKVLRESLTSDEYKPECRTIYSLLGLTLEANGEVKELSAPEDPVDLSQYAAVFVDEGGMVNKAVMYHIEQAHKMTGVKFIFMGDDAQLPPVGEVSSPIWKIAARADLTKVERHDNQILTLATRLHGAVGMAVPRIQLLPDHDEQQGVWKLDEGSFEKKILQATDLGAFSKSNKAKVIAWRNVTVDSYNKRIRGRLYPAVTDPWVAGDRVIFTAPAKDLEDEPVASTDDEGQIERVETEFHAIYGEFKIFRLSIVLDDNRLVVARVLHYECLGQYARRIEELSQAAREDRRKWRNFWDFKDAFHSLRYAYAITAHRAQGSTYDTAFVDWRDILLNRTKHEAYRCLYVACTRPKRCLVLN